MLARLKDIIENSHRVGLFIQILIVTSVIQTSLETIPSLRNEYKELWDILEILFVLIFSIEYLLRLYVSPHKIKFFLSFDGLIDLIAILPSILSLGVSDLRFVRAVRLLRVVRILKLARYSKALKRLQKAFSNIKEELIVSFALSVILLYIAATGIYYFENEIQPDVFRSIPHSLWWAVATLTTVGYGDAFPMTAGGKIFTFFMLMIGIGVISIPSALLANAFAKNENKKYLRKENPPRKAG